jgi:hypothetical protein
MGWTETYKDRDMSMDEFFEKEFGIDKPNSGFEAIGKGALVNASEYYRCFLNLQTNTYFVVCAKVHFKKDSYFNIAYKDMEETVCPFMYNCPERILKLAEQSEPTNDMSREWRENVHKVLAKKKAIKSLKVGDTIKLNKVLNFGKEKYKEDTFKVGTNFRSGRKCYYSTKYGFIARFTLADYEFTIV